jgi:hypothetical protein
MRIYNTPPPNIYMYVHIYYILCMCVGICVFYIICLSPASSLAGRALSSHFDCLGCSRFISTKKNHTTHLPLLLLLPEGIQICVLVACWIGSTNR